MSGFLDKIDDFFDSVRGRFWLWAGILSSIFLYGYLNHQNVLNWPSTSVWLSAIDADIYIRLTKVRELLEGGSLFNHDVIATNAPHGGITTPWTRPLDFILIALYQFTPSDFSIEKRLLLMANWYPLIMTSLIIYFLTKAAETGFKSTQKLIIVVLCLIIDIIFNNHNYFTVGNVDHHSLQALLWCIAIFLMLGRPSLSSATYLAASLGVWFWVSPEALPFIFAIYVIWGLRSVQNPQQAIYPLYISSIVTLITLVALFVEYPAADVLATRAYDTVSLIYVVFFSFCTLGFMVYKYIIAKQAQIKTRYVASAVAASLLAATFLALFPKFLKGPLADVDPYIFTHFLPSVSEATPFLKLDADLILGVLALSIPALLLSLRFIKDVPMIFVFLAVAFVMNFFQARWSYYLEIISIVAIAKFLPSYARTVAKQYNNFAYLLHPPLLMVYLCGIIWGISACLPPSKSLPYAYVERCKKEMFQIIQSGSLVNALGNSPLTIETNLWGNSGLPFFTPYHYVAGYYHREGEGLRTRDMILKSPDLEKIRPLLKERNISALLICPTADNSWTNEYFPSKSGASVPQRDWVSIHQTLQQPESFSSGDTSPVLLNIRP